MSDSTKSILIAGVGGQGILRASDILCQAFMATGLDVKKSEVHGMAQRGGCVTSHVRYGSKVFSPIAKKGSVDILLSFEKLETLRYLDYLRADGIVMINEEEIYPPSVNLGDAVYPDNVVALTSRYFMKVKPIHAPEIARRAGDVRTINTALLGALSTELMIAEDVWHRVLKESFSPDALEANLKAFNFGRQS